MEKNEKKVKLTLCDWCVLMGIITLIASVSHPALSQAMDEKKLSDMVDHLQTVRSQIRLYKAEHNGLFPGQMRIADQSVTCEEFLTALKEQQAGRTESYLGQIPVNPYISEPSAGSTITCVNDPDAHPTGTEGTGWWYNAATGEFYACDSQFHTNY